jgi:hypothetical protein
VSAIIEQRSTVGCELPAGDYVAILMERRPSRVTAYTAGGPVSGVPPKDVSRLDSKVDPSDGLAVFVIGAREAVKTAGPGVQREYSPIPTNVVEDERRASSQKQ